MRTRELPSSVSPKPKPPKPPSASTPGWKPHVHRLLGSAGHLGPRLAPPSRTSQLHDILAMASVRSKTGLYLPLDGEARSLHKAIRGSFRG
jgi:hypothetical protein